MALWLLVSHNKSLAHSSLSRFQTTTPMSIRPNVRAVPPSESTSGRAAASLKRVQASWRAESTGPSARVVQQDAILLKRRREKQRKIEERIDAINQQQSLSEKEREELRQLQLELNELIVVVDIDGP